MNSSELVMGQGSLDGWTIAKKVSGRAKLVLACYSSWRYLEIYGGRRWLLDQLEWGVQMALVSRLISGGERRFKMYDHRMLLLLRNT